MMRAEPEATTTLGEDRSEWPEVAIIVLNWNNYEDTAECLDTLENVAYPNYQTVVVDNNSSDGSLQKLEENFSWCKFISNSKNLGFAGGNNIGINFAIRNGYDHILLLNNDMTVTEEFLTPLVCVNENYNDVGIVSGVIRRANTNEIWFAGGKFYPKFVKTTKYNYIKTDGQPYESQHATGALLLLDSELIKDIGALNEDYFFAMEDTDISYRARNAGWKILIVPSSVAIHKVGGSSGEGTPFRYYHATRNRLYFSSEYLNNTGRFIFTMFFISSRFILLPRLLAKNPHIICGIVLGIYDSLMNREPRHLDYFRS